MLYIFRYIFGFLYIEFSGEFCEQLLNIAASNRIRLWGLKYSKGKITGYISIKNFKDLRYAKRKLKIRVRILKKCGLPFKTEKYKMRVGFIVGAAVFILLLNFLSGYIWNIEVCGNETVKKEDIINACKTFDVGIGTNKRKIKSSILSQKLALKIPEVAWGSFNVEGSKLTVNITETRLKQNRNCPNNIKAAADGIIEKIDISGGMAVLKVGDTVHTGDLIVSGTFESMNQTVFENITGTVTAKTTRTFTVSGNYKQQISVPQKFTVEHKMLRVFNIKIPLYLGNVQGDYESKTKTESLKITGCELPVSIITKKFTPLEKINVKYSQEELTKKLEKTIEKQIKDLKIKDYETENTKIEKSEKGITVNKTITAHENIAYFEEILIGDID